MADNPNIKNKLCQWAEQTAKLYVKIATDAPDHNLAFYQQTPLRDIEEPVEVVVMGINPGSGGSYTGQKGYKAWELNGKDATGGHLLNGNIVAWATHKEWLYWKNTKRLLSAAFGDKVEDDTKIVLTNATFFNTPESNILPKGLINETVGNTVRLIDILAPTSKIVVVLSGANCLGYLKAHYKDEFQEESVYGNKLILARLNGLTYIGIYHPASRYTNALTALVQKAIKLAKLNVTLELKDLKQLILDNCAKEWETVANYVPTANAKLQRAMELKQLLEQRLGVEKPLTKTLEIRINDDIEAVFVAQSNSQQIYWRHINYKGAIQYDNPTASYSHAAEILELLARYNYEQKPPYTSLGQKPLTAFNYMNDDIEHVVDSIMEEFESIGKEITKLFEKQ